MFRASSAFESGESRSKGHGKTLVLFNGSDENIELLLRTVISANQLSVYAATADLCNELSKDLRVPVKPATLYHLERTEIPTGPSIAENSYQYTATVKPGARIRATNRTIVARPEIIQTMLLCGFEACRNRTILLLS